MPSMLVSAIIICEFVNFGGAGATIFNLYLGGRILLFVHETMLPS